MSEPSRRERYAAKLTSAETAVRSIPPGRRFLVGSGAAAPNVFVEAMVQRVAGCD